MKCELCCDNDCLDLPSLTEIKGYSWEIHHIMGYVILESIIWFDLIWLDIPNLTENNIHYRNESFYYTADLQSTSTFPFISILFSRLDASALENVIRGMLKAWDHCSDSDSDSDYYYWETSENRISLPRWKKKKKIEIE